MAKRIAEQQRTPSASERAELAQWAGWGALAHALDPQSPQHAPMAGLFSELQQLVTPAELDAARRSTLNGHYTDPRYVDAVWQAMERLGFDKGTVLEPGCGSGNFIGAAPAGADCIGVELDPITAQIAQAIHPQASIRSESFAETNLPEGGVDLVVGNVPFGQVTLHDRRHNGAKHSIHNHFAIKGMHLLREGGVMAVITSRYTLDAQNPAARRELAQLGDLLGAVRLPTGAHRQTAGTDVVTDLLLIQRRTAGAPVRSEPFERSVTDAATGMKINEYFQAHPQNVLGTLELGKGEGGRPELLVRSSGDVVAQLTNALDRVVSKARQQKQQWRERSEPQAPAPIAQVGDNRPSGFLSTDGEGFQVIQAGGYAPHAVPSTQRSELRALLAIRDTAVSLLEAEATSNDNGPHLAALRTQLNRRYDSYVGSYGPINRFTFRKTGRLDPETGDEKLAKVRPRQGGFATDPFANVVFALEVFNEAEQTADKATIFQERVIARPVERLGADTPEDALAICLDSCGKVELPRIARLLGVPEKDARERLGELVFNEPGTSNLVIASEYLSGNVRQKLRQAHLASQENARYIANVTALKGVLPRDLQPAEIHANLGAVWIDAKHVQAFLTETLNDRSIRVESGVGSVWEVSSRDKFSVNATSRWGTPLMPAAEIAKSLLEQRPLRVYRSTEDGGRVVDATETLAAVEKGQEMSERFSDWVWEEPKRAAQLVRAYNSCFNAIVPRDYSAVRPSLAGLSLTFCPRDHQVTAVAQCLYEPAVGLFHEVGAGKTAAMVMAVMEKQRLGIVTKPIVVVPNHMLEQFSREWQQLYPQARLLAASKDDLTKARRQQFVARCATNRWDAIVMSRGAFERIPVSRETEAAYITQDLEQLRQALGDARATGKRLTLKRSEAILARREQRLAAILDAPKDPGITFEQLGVDHIVADEAHGYKNLGLVSAIPGMAIQGSQRASDMDQKLWYLRETVKSRNVVTFATATPIANSISEAYTMTRFLRPDVLANAGITAFDQWAATFGTTVTSLEVAPDGSSMRMQGRFARFHNVPELMQLWAPFANIRTAADLNLPTPKLVPRESDGQRAAEVVIVPPTEALLEFVDEIGDRAEQVRTRRVRPDQDNMLSITHAGRTGALDLRLLNRDANGSQKVDIAADKIAAIYEDSMNNRYPGTDGKPHPLPGALQLVFSDLGTPSKPGKWNVYDELRNLLQQRGVPRDQVRFMHEAKTDREKSALFAACREGRVSVLIGSTEKMGVGTNVQLRAIALHHLDCPWRPADITQREGRIIRQGNANPEVKILTYVTERSFDAYLWQTVTRKAAFIDQLMRRKGEVRQLDGDIGETALSFDEVKALASGNPAVLEHAQATAELQRLERLERAHHNSQSYLHRVAESNKSQVTRIERNLQGFERARERLTPHFAMRVGSEGFDQTKRGQANTALHQALQAAAQLNRGKPTWATTVGDFRGIEIRAHKYASPPIVALSLRELPHSHIEVDSPNANLVVRLANKAANLDKLELQAQFSLKQAREKVQRAKEDGAQPFAKRTELQTARERWRSLEAVLKESAKPIEVPPPETRWNALVESKSEQVRKTLDRLPHALAQRKEELRCKLAEHSRKKPPRGPLARLGAGREQRQEQWQASSDRIASTLNRVNAHMHIVDELRKAPLPGCASPVELAAIRRATRSAPNLNVEVHEARSSAARASTLQSRQKRALAVDRGRGLGRG